MNPVKITFVSSSICFLRFSKGANSLAFAVLNFPLKYLAISICARFNFLQCLVHNFKLLPYAHTRSVFSCVTAFVEGECRYLDPLYFTHAHTHLHEELEQR